MSNSQPARRLLVLFPALLLLANPHAARAQTTPAGYVDELAAVSAAAMTNDAGPAGIIPVAKGFNFSMGTASQHDSITGWSSLLTPDLAYRFNRHFSVDASVPLYGYINVDANVGTKARPVFAYKAVNGVFEDTSVSFHAEAPLSSVEYIGTVALGLESGRTLYGLGAGQPTYDLNSHFEKDLGIFTPDIEIGQGDTSSLVDRRIVKSYVAVGPMAHFQTGTAIDLPWNMTFEADAYEELPLAKNEVYSTTGKGKKKVTTSSNVDPTEDNGFLTTLDIPFSQHMTLSGYYDRSLRDYEDTAGFSFTFLLRAPPHPSDAR